MHIGKLSVNLSARPFRRRGPPRSKDWRPSDRPFFRARRIDVSLTWGALLNREVFIDRVTISDWQMVVETFPGDRHNFIRLPSRQGGPSRFVTTVQLVRAERGEFVYEDHGVPWSTIARNLDVTIAKTPEYRGDGAFHRRDRPDPELRADVGRHVVLVQDRQGAGAARSHRSDDRWRDIEGHGRRRSREMAGAGRTMSCRRSTSRACASCSGPRSSSRSRGPVSSAAGFICSRAAGI